MRRRSVVIALGVSVVLVVGVASPAGAVTAPVSAPVAAPATPVTSVPPLPVTPGKTYAPADVPSGQGAPAVAAPAVAATPAAPVTLPVPKVPQAPNVFTSVPVSFSPYETVYKNLDGSMVRKVSPTPINFKRADGSWVQIGTTVAADAKSGGFAVADNPLNPVFAAKTGTGADATVNNGSVPVSMSLVGAAAVSAAKPAASALHSVAEGLTSDAQSAVASSLQYSSVLPGQDLQYQATSSEVKETLVLNQVPSAATSSWTWRVHAPGLTLSKSDRSSFYLTDAAGVVQYNIPYPVMFDSSGVAGQSEASMVNVPTTFAQAATGDWLLTLTPDRAWLTNPARVYPVSVDPTLGTYATGISGFESDGVTFSGQGRTGNSRVRDSGGVIRDTYWRTVECYPYASLVQGSEITSGYMQYAYQAGQAANEPGIIAYATAPAYTGVGGGLSAWTVTNGVGNSADPTLPNQYQVWDNQNYTPACLMLIGNEVAGAYTYKDIDTALYLNYEAAPTITATAPVNGGRAGKMPWLTVSATNPSGSQNYYYKVSTNPNPDVSPVWTGGWTSSTSVQVPAGVLTPGTTYYWKAYVSDMYGASRNTGVLSFLANTPGVVPQAGSLPADKSVVTNLTPTFSIPAAGTDANGDTLQYKFQVATGTDGLSGQVASSGWQTGLSWAVPPAVLRDGTPYTWTVVVRDGYDDVNSWVNHITTDTRVTSAGPAPTDSAGPVTVNMANGNVSTSFSSPTVSTVGGPMGLSFNYNSEGPSNAGLTGTYYNAVPPGGGAPVLTSRPRIHPSWCARIRSCRSTGQPRPRRRG